MQYIFQMVKRSILFRYFISYISIFAIPLIILGIVLYSHSINGLQDEVERYTLARVSETRDSFDDRLIEVGKLAYKISNDDSITPAFVNTNDYRRKRVIEQLASYWDKSIVDDIFVKFAGNEYLYTLGGTTSFGTFADKYSINEDRRILLLDSISSTSKPIVVGLETDMENSVLCLFPLPLSGVNPYGTLGLVIDKLTMEGIAGNTIAHSVGSFSIYNDSLRKVYTIGDKNFHPEASIGPIMGHSDVPSISNIHRQGRELSVIQTTSDTSKFTYVIIMSPDHYL